MKQLNAVVVSNEQVWLGAYLLRAEAIDMDIARPGQYVMIHCGEGHDLMLRRPLSFHKVSEAGNVYFLFTVIGRGTEWLARCGPGDNLDIIGPLGNGFKVYPSSRNLLLVAGGIGVAPLVALAEYASVIGCSVTLLIGSRTAAQIYPVRLLPPGIITIVITEDGSEGLKGMATDFLPKYVSGADQIFACGPLPMYQSMANMIGKLGGKPVQVLLEVVLGCGVGACLSCTIETRRGQRQVCKDGPVFELSEILWDKIVAPRRGVSC